MESYTHRVWIPEDEPGIEDVRLAHDATSVLFSGTLIRLLEGLPLHLSYTLRCDTEWCVRELRMTGESAAAGDHTFHLFSDGAGNWHDDKGQTLDALQGCIDVDIMLTPLTNTLPIRRLQLAPGESREISVVYVAAPDLSIRPFRQRYTRLDDADGGQRYRYESVESGFTAVLPVDDDGFVIDYPGIWRRVWPTA
ncbi:MAG TPA: putative glycolipid-binding domain-containing protein [Ktedonobacterales bacterium]|nr:putative glycolipid-binding domain-containing protein [Ktedonobacterales bacterium]